MTRLKLIAALTALTCLGVLVTQPTVNDLNLDLPAATQGVPESPVVMRIGVVTDIVEADNITVQISGSPVLVTASYLWPQYQPVPGDRVVVYRQDSQWFVVGTMSGPNNTALLNPGFELGNVGSAPTNWTVGGGVDNRRRTHTDQAARQQPGGWKFRRRGPPSDHRPWNLVPQSDLGTSPRQPRRAMDGWVLLEIRSILRQLHLCPVGYRLV